ncbi:MAG TPA: PilZ domain-containing protein [Haliangiales bacterium]|nr:PilZ domain-containing protein [Haliangiales bacterium]
MNPPAPLAVAAEIRALDVGARVDRVWRTTRAIGVEGVRLERDMPFEPGRPVAVTLTLPDDGAAVSATGVVEGVAPDDEAREGEAARPRAVAFVDLPEDARRRILDYVRERTQP